MSNKGKDYEEKIFRICKVKGCVFPGTSNAGGGGGIDVILSHNEEPMNLEIKSDGADWGQEGLKFINNKWIWNNSNNSTEYFNAINALSFIDNDFVPKNMCPEGTKLNNWNSKKKELIGLRELKFDQSKFEKSHIHISLEPLVEFYNSKNCFYIQLKNFGLYHLGFDKYNLKTPNFDGTIYLRFRVKMHDHFERRILGLNKSKKGKIVSKLKLIPHLFSEIDDIGLTFKEQQYTFNEVNSKNKNIFEVLINGKIACLSYKEIFDLVNETTGHNEQALKEQRKIKITKYPGSPNQLIFTIDPTPWKYSFFGTMKLDKKPTKSHLSIEPNKTQSFPEIAY